MYQQDEKGMIKNVPGYRAGYKRGRRVSSLKFQRLCLPDFFESAPGYCTSIKEKKVKDNI